MARITLANIRKDTIRHKGVSIMDAGSRAGKSEKEILADLAAGMGLNEAQARHWYKWAHANCGLDADTPLVAAPTWSGRIKKEKTDAAPANADEAKAEAAEAVAGTTLDVSDITDLDVEKLVDEDTSEFLKELEAQVEPEPVSSPAPEAQPQA